MAKGKTPKLPPTVAHNRRLDVLDFRGYISLIIRLCVISCIVYILFSHVFLITQANGMGMFPAIEDGDLILAYRLQEEYAKGDVVIYEADGGVHLGRVVAAENDQVVINDSGSLIINNLTQSGDIMYPTYAKAGNEYPLTIQEEELYVLGDYRTQTQDSRDFGPISLDDIKAKVITIVRRRGV